MGQLTLDKRPARIGIRNQARRAAIPSKGSFLAETIHNIAYNIIIRSMYVQYVKNVCMKIFLVCRLKINHPSEGWNMPLFLAPWTERLRTLLNCVHLSQSKLLRRPRYSPEQLSLTDFLTTLKAAGICFQGGFLLQSVFDAVWWLCSI